MRSMTQMTFPESLADDILDAAITYASQDWLRRTIREANGNLTLHCRHGEGVKTLTRADWLQALLHDRPERYMADGESLWDAGDADATLQKAIFDGVIFG